MHYVTFKVIVLRFTSAKTRRGDLHGALLRFLSEVELTDASKMRAAVLQNDRTLQICSVEVPTLLSGSAQVEVKAVTLLKFAKDVVSGTE